MKKKIFERIKIDCEAGKWVHYYLFGKHIGTKIIEVYHREK